MLVKNIAGKDVKVRVQGEDIEIKRSNTFQTTLDKAREILNNYPTFFELITDMDAYVADIAEGGGSGGELEGRIEDLEKTIVKKVDIIEGKGLSTSDYTPEEKVLVATIENKVDQEEGKGLSTNDFDNQYKLKLDNLEDYLDETIAKMNSLTKEVVVELPRIEEAVENVMYLKKESEESEVFEMYTLVTEGEEKTLKKIGTTETNMDNYYNKDEADDKFLTIEDGQKQWYGTQAEYDALTVKPENTDFNIYEE